ncbi:hypothetical protein PTSG_03818 [Salpingoeca rosetta]|uniref:Saposin B-type domain-containing protein n=1 Tax=Salpingoeca rosetta (strain ATCC 50818 / BSB-021) TaxID=946362 RepID=F2U5H1_SALR5|nr:uncharacterized protein PTSG_03818 [Salpingoeca rosetta]EGD83187.1 hypothetical protein PTSG_03818 [Salpingoeca rosetta]|eukprot:XP_004995551.1 hypothetical protein PTSG_03818 [Salpingoeca rosetta]
MVLRMAELAALVAVVVACLVPLQGGMARLLGDTTCGELPTMLQAVETACEVNGLEELYHSVNYAGPPNFCAASCVNAVSALHEALSYCETAEAVLGTAGVRASVRSINRQQAACNAPSVACLRVQREFDSWLRTATGEGCLDVMADAATLPDTEASQAQLRSTCTGTCHSGFTYYLAQLEEAGCVDWALYQLHRESFDLTCATTTDDGTSDTIVYCRNKFSPEQLQEQLRTARNTSRSQAERDTALQAICTPCLFEYIQVEARKSSARIDVAELDLLCARDSTTFCYPRVMDVLVFTTHAGPAQRAQQLCSLGECSDKVLARLRNTPQLASLSNAASVAEELVQHADAHLKYMCLQSEEGDVCVDVMDAIISGFDENLAFQGTAYFGPDACEDIGTGDYCTWGCQRRLDRLVDAVGCCHHSIRTYLTEIGTAAAEVDDAFAPVEAVTSECGHDIGPACTVYNEDVAADVVLVVPFPKSFVRAHKDVLALELVSVLGRPADSFKITRISDGTQGSQTETTSNVHIELVFESATRRDQVVSSVAADAARGSLAFLTLPSLHYNQTLGLGE